MSAANPDNGGVALEFGAQRFTPNPNDARGMDSLGFVSFTPTCTPMRAYRVLLSLRNAAREFIRAIDDFREIQYRNVGRISAA